MMRCLVVANVMLLWIGAVVAGDWPTYRADAARSGYTADPLPARLSLRWAYHPHQTPQPAWPRDQRMSFDRVHHVVVADGRLFFGSTSDGKVYALDAATGQPLWEFFTDSPVRFAPTVWKDRVFVVSDDGFLYCLDSADGQLIQKWRGGPRDERVLGNQRIVSKWPARGGPVIYDGILYWAAGIWPSEGVFLVAMDPDTGQIHWKNDDSGGITMPQPHGGASAASGVTAQGYLLATEDQLFVPTGRAVPAAFSRADGKFQYYRLQENSPRGGTFAMAAGPYIYNGGGALETVNGQLSPSAVDGAVAGFPDGIICGFDNRLRALAPALIEAVDRRGEPVSRLGHELLWEMEDVSAGTSLIVAGPTIVSTGGAQVSTVDIETKAVVWTAQVDDVAHGLAAANGCLYVSTTSGAIYCYGEVSEAEPVVRKVGTADTPADATASAAAKEIIQRSGITEGYCVDLGCGDGALALELARRTQLQIIAIDSDPRNVATARNRLDAAGYYGVRVTVHLGPPSESHYPKYFANLVVSGRSLVEGAASVDQDELGRLQRPYGGVACVGKPGQMEVRVRGPLEEAGEWTHQYANAANTLCSADTIKGPLTMLWFRDVDLDLPQRHGRGPAPLFRDGRLFVEGLDGLMAVDAYNGRPIWRFAVQGIAQAYNADHLAGTAITGSNFCLGGDSLFLRHGHQCYRIDTATGTMVDTYHTPARDDDKSPPWGFVACEAGILFGSVANDQHVVRHAYQRADEFMQSQFSESTTLFALDVETGRLLWRYDARESIRHNAIAIGSERVFLIDRPLDEGDLLSATLAPRGVKPEEPTAERPAPELIALHAKTGQPIWHTRDDVFGTTLAFSEESDLLVMFYQSTRFKLPSEMGGRMAVYGATDGHRVWVNQVNSETRPLINGGTIVAYPSAVDLVTGEVKSLGFSKSYGCGQLSGSKFLLLFRSATMAYFDLARLAGVENYGGIRPGCWINALPVGGIVLLPDASAGCRCSYQNRAWAAFQGN